MIVFGARYARPVGPGGAYLARFDGHSVVFVTPPPVTKVNAYVEDDSGVAWAISSESDTPWRREPLGEWQAVPLALRYVPAELSISSDGNVWVQAYGPIVGDGASRRPGGNVGIFTTAAVEHPLGIPIPESDDP